MKLVVEELKAVALEQVVTPSRHVSVEAIRPRLYRHNFATGSLKLQIHDSDDNLIAESELVNIADIGTQPYLHGHVRFFIDAFLTKDQDYTISLIGGDGYSFSESAYIGWVNSFDLATYEPSATPVDFKHYPLDLQIWERTL